MSKKSTSINRAALFHERFTLAFLATAWLTACWADFSPMAWL